MVAAPLFAQFGCLFHCVLLVCDCFLACHGMLLSLSQSLHCVLEWLGLQVVLKLQNKFSKINSQQMIHSNYQLTKPLHWLPEHMLHKVTFLLHFYTGISSFSCKFFSRIGFWIEVNKIIDNLSVKTVIPCTLTEMK